MQYIYTVSMNFYFFLHFLHFYIISYILFYKEMFNSSIMFLTNKMTSKQWYQTSTW